MTEPTPPDLWHTIEIFAGGYNNEVDRDIIRVIKYIHDKPPGGATIEAMVPALGLAASHIELIQYILCSAELCGYGMSPRTCWLQVDGEKLLADCEEYYRRRWNQEISYERSE